MPLGARDVFIVVHAKDQASRVLRNVATSFFAIDDAAKATAQRQMALGGALVGVGGALAVIGGLGVRAMMDMAGAAVDYNNQAALTLTQLQGTETSLEDVKRIGREVALAIPAPFAEMQGGLYDIFSSMDVNVSEAQTLLEGFAKAAVAGQVPLQTAGRATIAVMNAWGLPVEDLNHVLDVQFELVRSGVGTYEEFASTIGRAIPSARRAGQNYETLAGTLAFLTRNGLSADMAATSAARAFDTLANPKVVDRLAEMGVEVLDSNGNFRQMNEIVTDLVEGPLADLTDAERARALNEMLQGAGNSAQARRFWDLAIRHHEELNDLTERMINSSGALEDAYEIMLEDPQVMMQALSNQWEVLKTELGDAVLPVLLLLATVLSEILGWFNKLSPETKTWIAYVLLLGSALALVIGILAVFAGTLLILSGAATLMGTSLGVLIGVFLLVVGAAILAAYLIKTHWDTLKRWWDWLWPYLEEAARPFIDWLQNELWPTAQRVWNDIAKHITTILIGIGLVILLFAVLAYRIWTAMHSDILDNTLIAFIILTSVISGWLQAIAGVFEFFTGIITGEWGDAWNGLYNTAVGVFKFLIASLAIMFFPLILIMTTGIAALKWLWETFGDDLQNIAMTAWTRITQGFGLFMNGLKLVGSVVSGAISKAWETFWTNIHNVTTWFTTTIQNTWGLMWMALSNVMTWTTAAISNTWSNFWNTMSNVLTWMSSWVSSQWNRFWGNISNVTTWFIQIVTDTWNRMFTGIEYALAVATPIIETAMNLFMAPFSALNGLMWLILGIGNTLVSWFKTAFNFVLGIGGISGPLGIILGLLSGIYGMITAVRQAWGFFTSGVGVITGGIGSSIRKVGARVTGNATGTNSLRGWGIVGEAGAELMHSGPGGITQIIPNALSSTMMGRSGGIGGGGGSTVVLQVQGPIADRRDLVYQANKELEWHEFVRGR